MGMSQSRMQSNRRTTELLAPVGDIEALQAAVESGADAVYMGMTNFNARLKSDNFDKDDFERAVDYAHSKDVFVYLTLNTLIRNDEMNLALETARFAANAGVDAFIVQDVGLAGLLRTHFPEVRLHASTQMSICDAAGVAFAQKIGASRVVLARELTLTEIQDVASSTDLELEVFVHGALCICYSGQCLMSSMLGGRSGNRGSCAQPCRLPYQLEIDRKIISNNHLLSPKDLCGLAELPALVALGVKSLKIEGRMKSPDYVAATTKIYRKYLDLALQHEPNYHVEAQDLEMLMQVFNRGGYSNGWLTEGPRRSLMSVEKAKNWGLLLGTTQSASDQTQLAEVKLARSIQIGDGIEIWNGQATSPGGVVSILKKENAHIKVTAPGDIVSIGVVKGAFGAGYPVYQTSSKSLREGLLREVKEAPRKVKVSGAITLENGKPARLSVYDFDGNQSDVTSTTLGEPSQKVVLTKERIAAQLQKTGDAPFFFQNIDVNLEDGVYFPLSELSALRRAAFEGLHAQRIAQYKREYDVVETTPPQSKTATEQTISVLFANEANLFAIKSQRVARVYFPIRACAQQELPSDVNYELHAWLPAGTKQASRAAMDQMVAQAVANGIKGLLLGGIGDLQYMQAYPALKFRLNFGFPVYNSFTAAAIAPVPVTVSPELEPAQIALLAGEDLEAVAYARFTLMTSAQCFVHGGACDETAKSHCAAQHKVCEIVDGRDRRFRLLRVQNGCGSIVLDAESKDTIAAIAQMKNIDSFRIEVCDESESKLNQLITRIEVGISSKKK